MSFLRKGNLVSRFKVVSRLDSGKRAWREVYLTTTITDDGEGFIQKNIDAFVLLWTKNTGNAPYICIEPWCGFPDMIDSDYDITKRPGIVKIDENGTHSVTHTITIVK